MRVAALYDIHSNLPALDAVLAEVHQAGVDRIVVGGDVLPGPMPRETMARLLALDIPTTFIYGNGDLAILAQLRAATPSEVTYWGTSSGAPLPEPFGELFRWTAQQVREYQDVLASWPLTTTLDIDGLGKSCSATRRRAMRSRSLRASRLKNGSRPYSRVSMHPSSCAVTRTCNLIGWSDGCE
jgi:hypothetical protein